MRRDIRVDRLLAGAVVAEVVRLVGFDSRRLPTRSRAWPKTPEAAAESVSQPMPATEEMKQMAPPRLKLAVADQLGRSRAGDR